MLFETIRESSAAKPCNFIYRTDHERGLPVKEIVCAFIGRPRPPITRRKVLEKFDARPPANGSKTRNA
jgi:hypothetical protein